MKTNKRYQFYKEQHPDWSEEQIWTAVSIDMQTAQTVKEGGDDVDVNNSEIVKIILEKAQEWLEEVLPKVFEKVKDLFMRAINTIAEWIEKGINYLIEIIFGRRGPIY